MPSHYGKRRKRNYRRRYNGRRGSRRSFRRYSGRGTQPVTVRQVNAFQTGSRNFNKQQGGILRFTSLQPDFMLIKFKYTDILQLDNAMPTNQILYSGNGLLDPNGGSLGTAYPLAFPEWMVFYFRYRVMASKIRVQVVNAAGTQGLFCALYPSLIPSIVAHNYESAVSQPYSNQLTCGHEDGGGKAEMTSYMNTVKLWGDKNQPFVDGTLAANPLDEWFWKLFFLIGGEVSAIVGSVQVHITYYTKLYSRRVLQQEIPPAFLKSLQDIHAGHEVDGLQIVSAHEQNLRAAKQKALAITRTLSMPPAKRLARQRALGHIPKTPPPPVVALGPNGTEIISDEDIDISMKEVSRLVNLPHKELDKFLDL